jgi:hypothetical protein
MALLGVDELETNGNYGEAALWWLIALAFVYYALRQQGAARRRCWTAAVVFLAFGLSDVVEAHTGAWWQPWWLLVWKAACVIAMAALLVGDWRARRKTAPTAKPSDVEEAEPARGAADKHGE